MDKNKIRPERPKQSGCVKYKFGWKLLAVVLVVLLAVGSVPMKVSVQAAESDGNEAEVSVQAAESGEDETEVSQGEVTEDVVQEGESVAVPYAAGEVQTGSVDGIVSGSVTWSYDPETKTTTVTGTGERNVVVDSTSSTTSPFPSETESVRFENCKIIGSCGGLFSGLANLETIDFHGFDTGSVTDMRQMFSDCSGLTTLDVSSLDTSSVTDMWAMFSGCSSLATLDVSSLDTSSVTYMASMFNGCSSLTTLDVSSLDTSNVTSMGFMFYSCSSLTSLDVSSLDTSSVMDMMSMFNGCSSLAALDVSSFDTSGVTAMDSMFRGCSGLETLDVGSFDTSSVTYMGYMFSGCSGLDTLDVSGLDTSSVTDMGGMFSGCSGLETLNVSGLDTSSVTDMNCMFQYCSGLESLDVSGFDTSNVTDMGGMFWTCSGLTFLDVSGFDTSNVTSMVTMFSGCSRLTSVNVSGFDTNNVTDMDHMFFCCYSLTSLNLSGFDTSNVTTMEDMFYQCNSLDELHAPTLMGSASTNLPGNFVDPDGNETSELTVAFAGKKLTKTGTGAADNIQTGSVDGIISGSVTWTYDPATKTTAVTGTGWRSDSILNNNNYNSSFPAETESIRFENCKISGSCWCLFYDLSNLRTIDFSGFDTSSVTSMVGMFSDCSGLTSVDIRNLDTSSVKLMGCMFSGCSGLTSVDMRGLDTSSVTGMYNMFQNCSSLTSVDMRGLDTSNVTSMAVMFDGCSSLMSLDVSGFDTSRVAYMTGMFSGCSGLTSLDVSRFNTGSVRNMSGMFNGCSSLTSLDVSSFDTSNVTTMADMFYQCNSLDELYAPVQMGSVSTDLPGTFVDPDGNETSELTAAFAGKKLTKAETAITAEELPSAVIYAPYEYAFDFESLRKDGYGQFVFENEAFPKGLSVKEDSRLCLSGVPTEAGEFSFRVAASGQNVSEKTLTYRLTVEQNTDTNVETSTDEGYELVETVPDLQGDDLPAKEEQTMRSVGDYEEFVDLYLDGGKLIRGEGDTLTGDAEYLANPGSTRITILNQTLAKNGSGTHTLAMEFRKADTGELRRAAQNYTIEGEVKPDTGDNGGDNGSGDEEPDEDWDEEEDVENDDTEEDIPQPTPAPQPTLVPQPALTPQPTAGPQETVPENPYESAYFDFIVDWTAVGGMIDAAASKQNVDVLAGGQFAAPAWILTKCVARDVTLALHLGNRLALSITGRDIKQADKPLEVSMGYPAQIPDAEREAVLKGVLAGRVFEVTEMAEAGTVSYPVNVHFALGSEYAGKQCVLYYYDKDTVRMVPEGICTVAQAGQAMFGIRRSGSYIVAVFGDNPGEGVSGVYTVVRGDNLSRIAAKYKVTVDSLMKDNPWLKSSDRIYPGQKIVVR